MNEVDYLKSGFESTNDTTYVALTGEIWGVFIEDFEKIEILEGLTYKTSALVQVFTWYRTGDKPLPDLFPWHPFEFSQYKC